MAKKRANSEGTVYKRPNGKWRAQVTLYGKRLSFSADTQQECLTWIRKTRTEIEDHGITFKGTKITLQDYLKDWLITVSSSRTNNTYRNYTWIVNSRIVPIIGEEKIHDLTPDKIQRFYGILKSKGGSDHQISCVHKTLRVAMNHAVKLGYIGRNPVNGTTPPKPRQSEMRFYDEKQVIQLLETAIKIDDRLYSMYYLAIHTGMRQAELMGLKWEDINWKNKTIQVRRQVLHQKGGGYSYVQPKSKAGNRTIILGNKAISVLKAQKKDVDDQKLEVGEDWVDNDLIFPSSVGTPLRAMQYQKRF